MSAPKHIVAVAEAAGQYGAFLDLLEAADLKRMLAQDGPFTVFAPTDAAFAALAQDLRAQLFESGDKSLRRAVLGYHFAAGEVAAARFAGKRIRARSFSGGGVIIEGAKAGLRVNGARCVDPDRKASNGVIHGIDGVLWPKAAAAAVGAQ